VQVLRTFMYAGYNRLGPCPVHHYHLRLDQETTGLLEPRAGRLARILHELERGLEPLAQDHASPAARRRPEVAGAWFARLSLAIQRAAGHRVKHWGIESCELDDQTRPWFEYDHPDTGHAAAELARELILQTLSGEPMDGDGSQPGWLEWLRGRVEDFVEAQVALATPPDTLAILDAAARRGIPRLRLDRPPAEPIEGSFRLRPNSLLRLGQGCRQHTVDGTFSVSRSEPVFPLLRDRQARLERLANLGISVPCRAEGAGWVIGETRALRAARRIGWPVVVRPQGNHGGRVTTLAVADEAALRQGVRRALGHGELALVEPYVAGSQWLLLVGGGSCMAALTASGQAAGAYAVAELSRVHPSTRAVAERIARELDVGLLAVQVVATAIDQPLEAGNGMVVDVDLAPRLDRWFTHTDQEMRQLASAFVDWMFPDASAASVPVVAVTGTNGKTTTSRMLHRMLLRAGHRTGLACSDGSLVDQRELSTTEDGHLIGHLTILDHPDVEVAVLEATRGSAGSTGLGFEHCKVGICLNVTEDHLNDRLAIASVDEMARIKRSILETSNDAVVLNADDRRCLAMMGALPGRRIGLVSRRRSAMELRGQFPDASTLAVVEAMDGRDWLVLHGPDGRVPVVAVADIPVCHQGHAVHNVSNALHALLAAHFMDLAPAIMADALINLDAGFETHFGRLNRIEGLPFDLFIDYAHNPDGLAHLSEFVRRHPTRGRRILNFSCSADNSDGFIRRVGRAAAGSFDFYVCKPFGTPYDRQRGEVTGLLRQGLLEAGVSDDRIELRDEEFESVRDTLEMARAGDLVVVIAGKRKRAIHGMVLDWIAGRAV
jgi:UDP-N-acetylmuramyl tripeptide synthase